MEKIKVSDRGRVDISINEGILKHYSLHDKEYHVYYEGLNATVNDMYMEEVRHFFACIEGTAQPSVCLREGKRIQEIIMKIKKSSELGHFVSV